MTNNSLINKPMYVENNLLEKIGQKNKGKNRNKGLVKKIVLPLAGLASLGTVAAFGANMAADYVTEKHQENLEEMSQYFSEPKTVNVDSYGTNYNIQARKLLNELHNEYPKTRGKYNLSDLKEYIREVTNNGEHVSPNENYDLPQIE